VLEHLGEPAAVFGELFRVLKPGGLFLAKTPNKWHYMPTIARLTPHSFHAWVNKKRGRHETDTFPTRYRANTPADISRLAAASGMVVENIELIEGRPEYLRMTAVTYVAGWLYERVVNLVPWLSKYRILLVVSLRKPL
jgi:SAM-dependent methyltransferase